MKLLNHDETDARNQPTQNLQLKISISSRRWNFQACLGARLSALHQEAREAIDNDQDEPNESNVTSLTTAIANSLHPSLSLSSLLLDLAAFQCTPLQGALALSLKHRITRASYKLVAFHFKARKGNRPRK